uniref:Cerebellin 7 n=1 Tax=Sinocyclocheilus anshuiensis TaxID=1608454 RepID=A0A671KLE8_9TELE
MLFSLCSIHTICIKSLSIYVNIHDCNGRRKQCRCCEKKKNGIKLYSTTAMFLSSAIFKVYGSPNSETQVSKLSLSFSVVNRTREAVHVQFVTRKLVFTIIPIAQEHNIAFSATLGNRGDVGPFNTNVPLVYQKVFLNAGSCYNTGTGIFTAPVKGVYFFSLSGHNKTSKPMALRLFKNGEPMTIIYNHPLTDAGIRYESLSNSITLMLEKGDQVFVHLLANTWVFDNNDNLTLFTVCELSFIFFLKQ